MKKELQIVTVLTSSILLLNACASVPQQTEKKYLFGYNKPLCQSTIIKIPTANYPNENHNVIVSLDYDNKTAIPIYASSKKYANNLMQCFNDNQIKVFNQTFKDKKRINVRFYLRELRDYEKENFLQQNKLTEKVFNNDKYSYKYLKLYIKKLPYRAKLRYPRREKKLRKEGIVKLVFTINEAGRATDIKVVKSSSKAFSKNAIRALKMSIFDTSQFPTIPYRATESYNFKLK